ncbi:MAG: XRE family transcriptional regulator [Loigolactobacillus coryniformis]|uniref:LexA family transcriptional regulator n=1 Tax=Loigolactobacillus coryniformis TaxID=1610 RepID=UPI00264877CB|nr:XRE family transcriptional regulator [Loigolactobacillus coryniformis]MDN5954130.1 XRE family transcriptional regulator [Loigolactobacillus coryniformis]
MRSNKEIIDYMRVLLKRRKLSLNQLADKAGVAKSTVSRYFSFTRQFPLNKADDFAKALGTTSEDLLGVSPIDNLQNTNSHTYAFLPAHIAAGVLTSVDPLMHRDVEHIELSDAIMRKYAGDKDIAVMYVNGDSMNHVIPDGSLMAIKLTGLDGINNGDIVVFSEDGSYSVKRYYDNKDAKIITFSPDSSNPNFEPITYRYEDAENVRIIGKVVVYTVVL